MNEKPSSSNFGEDGQGKAEVLQPVREVEAGENAKGQSGTPMAVYVTDLEIIRERIYALRKLILRSHDKPAFLVEDKLWTAQLYIEGAKSLCITSYECAS